MSLCNKEQGFYQSDRNLLEQAVALLETFTTHDDKIMGDDPWYCMDPDDRAAIDEFLVQAKVYV